MRILQAIDTFSVGTSTQLGLFTDWAEKLKPHVAAGHHLRSPQKYICAEYRGVKLAGGRFVQQRGSAETLSSFSPKGRDRKNSYPICYLQLAGNANIQQGARETALRPGQFAFVDLSRPCEIERSGDWEALAIQFSSSCFQPSVLQEVLTLPMGTEFPADTLFFKASCELWEIAQTIDYHSHGLIFDTLRSLALLTSAFQGAIDVKSNARVDRAKAFIEQHIDDESLSAAMVADAQGISRRHLDNCFTQIGPSVDSYIWERRLALAAEKLSQTSLANRSLLQISLDLGFKGPSHFSKAFRNRYSTSPRIFRQNALKDKLSQGQ